MAPLKSLPREGELERERERATNGVAVPQSETTKNEGPPEEQARDDDAFSDISDNSDVYHISAQSSEEPHTEEEADLLIAESTMSTCVLSPVKVGFYDALKVVVMIKRMSSSVSRYCALSTRLSTAADGWSQHERRNLFGSPLRHTLAAVALCHQGLPFCVGPASCWTLVHGTDAGKPFALQPSV